MIVLKIFLIVCIILMSLWTFWSALTHFNIIEGEQPYDNKFPWFRLIIGIVLIVICVSVW